jgi:hypothetical protein
MNEFKKTLTLPKVAYSSKAKRNAGGLVLTIGTEGQGSGEKRDWITLQPITVEVPRICGHIWNACRTDWATGGQCDDTIREYYGHIPKVRRILELWEAWHLNDMKSGTQAQLAVIDAYKLALSDAVTGLTGADAVANVDRLRKTFGSDYYKTACDVLKRAGLYVDRGYTYGHGWLVAVPSDEVIEELKSLFS